MENNITKYRYRISTDIKQAIEFEKKTTGLTYAKLFELMYECWMDNKEKYLTE